MKDRAIQLYQLAQSVLDASELAANGGGLGELPQLVDELYECWSTNCEDYGLPLFDVWLHGVGVRDRLSGAAIVDRTYEQHERSLVAGMLEEWVSARGEAATQLH